MHLWAEADRMCVHVLCFFPVCGQIEGVRCGEHLFAGQALLGFNRVRFAQRRGRSRCPWSSSNPKWVLIMRVRRLHVERACPQ